MLTKFDSSFVIKDQELGNGLNKIYPYRKHFADDKWAVQVHHLKDLEGFTRIINGIVLNFNSNHPGIVPVLGFFIEPGQPEGWRVYTKIPRIKQTLRNFIEEDRFISVPILVKMFHNLAWGLEYLHQKKIAHKNISSMTVVMDKEGIPRLMDMSLGEWEGDEFSMSTREFGENVYLGPEKGRREAMKKENVYKADVWNLGIVMAELFEMKGGLINASMGIEERRKKIEQVLKNVSERYGKELGEILRGMLDHDPDNRSSAKHVRVELEKKFIKELREPWVQAKELVKMKEPIREPVKELVKAKEQRPIQEEDIMLNERAMFHGFGTLMGESSREGFVRVHEIEENASKLLKSSVRSINEEVKIEDPDSPEKEMQNYQNPNKIIQYIPGELRKVARLEWEDGWNIKPIDDEEEEKKIIDFIKFLTTVPEIKTLEWDKLGFDVSGCSKLTDKGLEKLGEIIGQSYKKLEALNVELSWCEKITDQGIKKFSSNVCQGLKYLKDLTLEFSECVKMTNNGVKFVTESIGLNLKNLECLNLNFYGCVDIGDEGIYNLSRNLAMVVRLQRLVLQFTGCLRITDRGIKPLAFNSGSQLKQLTRLTLDFYGCIEISNEGLLAVVDQFLHKENQLVELNLNFCKCNKINSDGLKKFAENLKNLKSLFKLSLDFENCITISDEGSNYLLYYLCENLSVLEELSLNFSNCVLLTDDGIKNLERFNKEKNKKLRQATLYFSGCEKISHSSKEKMRQRLQFIDDLDLQ